MKYYVIDWRAKNFRLFSTWEDVQMFFALAEVSVLDREAHYMVIKGQNLDPCLGCND